MATALSLQPVAFTDLGAITPFAGRSATSVSNAAVAESTSSVVRLSALGRFLAATPATDTASLTPTAASQNIAVTTAVPQTAAPNADTVAAAQNTSAANFVLQSLANDPALRAIANNLFNPVYSALVAAAHQADFTTPQPLTRANAISSDIPTPVLSVAPTDAINNYQQAAQEFGQREAKANSWFAY